MKESQAGKPRRPHHKSRTGCAQCKHRKVKCDETKPVCQKCSSHGQTCSYLLTQPLSLPHKRGPTISSMLVSEDPTPSPSTPSSYPLAPISTDLALPLPTTFTILDLELLHFWSTRSCSTFVDFPACITLFQTTVVQLALKHHFLLHEILSLSALHMSLLQTTQVEAAKYMHASSSHLATALSLFQPEIANLTIENCHACFAFSTTIFTHSWAAQDMSKPSALFFAPKNRGAVEGEIVQWVKLHRSANSILQGLWSNLTSGPMEPLFAPWKDLDPNRPNPLNDTEARELAELSLVWNSPSSRLGEAQKKILDKALDKLIQIFSMLEFSPEISKLSAVMAWFSLISDDYLKMLEEKVHEALLLVVFYCVTLKRLDHLWWVEGKGENLLRTVVAELGDGCEWERYLRWPVEQVMGSRAVGGFAVTGRLNNVSRLAMSNIMNVD